MTTEPFLAHVIRALAATNVASNLTRRRAVVLERLARGGGGTNWYHCQSEDCLHELARRLAPGSLTSFYFDDRIGVLETSAAARAACEAVFAIAHECVVGALAEDGLSIEVDFVTTADEVGEFLAQRASARLFFAGQFPGRDDDGTDAVTVVIPDRDGEVRRHPY